MAITRKRLNTPRLDPSKNVIPFSSHFTETDKDGNPIASYTQDSKVFVDPSRDTLFSVYDGIATEPFVEAHEVIGGKDKIFVDIDSFTDEANKAMQTYVTSGAITVATNAYGKPCYVFEPDKISLIDASSGIGTAKGIQFLIPGAALEVSINARGMDIRRTGDKSVVYHKAPTDADKTFNYDLSRNMLDQMLGGIATKYSISVGTKPVNEWSDLSPEFAAAMTQSIIASQPAGQPYYTGKMGKFDIMVIPQVSRDLKTKSSSIDNVAIVRSGSEYWLLHNGSFRQVEKSEQAACFRTTAINSAPNDVGIIFELNDGKTAKVPFVLEEDESKGDKKVKIMKQNDALKTMTAVDAFYQGVALPNVEDIKSADVEAEFKMGKAKRDAHDRVKSGEKFNITATIPGSGKIHEIELAPETMEHTVVNPLEVLTSNVKLNPAPEPPKKPAPPKKFTPVTPPKKKHNLGAYWLVAGLLMFAGFMTLFLGGVGIGAIAGIAIGSLALAGAAAVAVAGTVLKVHEMSPMAKFRQFQDKVAMREKTADKILDREAEIAALEKGPVSARTQRRIAKLKQKNAAALGKGDLRLIELVANGKAKRAEIALTTSKPSATQEERDQAKKAAREEFYLDHCHDVARSVVASRKNMYTIEFLQKLSFNERAYVDDGLTEVEDAVVAASAVGAVATDELKAKLGPSLANYLTHTTRRLNVRWFNFRTGHWVDHVDIGSRIAKNDRAFMNNYDEIPAGGGGARTYRSRSIADLHGFNTRIDELNAVEEITTAAINGTDIKYTVGGTERTLTVDDANKSKTIQVLRRKELERDFAERRIHRRKAVREVTEAADVYATNQAVVDASYNEVRQATEGKIKAKHKSGTEVDIHPFA